MTREHLIEDLENVIALAKDRAGGDPRRLRSAFAGLRLPNPEKDSVLIVHAQGTSLFALRAADTGACGSATGQRLRVFGAPSPGIVLLYENAIYFFRDRALRIRTGAEGRQPITEEWFVDAGTQIVTADRVIEPFGLPEITFDELLELAASPDAAREYYQPLVDGVIADWQEHVEPIEAESE